MAHETQKLLRLELLDGVLKSWWTLVAGVCVGASLAVVALHFTRPVYEAEATIGADVERLPREFVKRTISDNVEVQLSELRGAVLSDENLKRVITAAFGTPHSQSHEQALASKISSNVGLQFWSRTQTISVRYRDPVPARAAQVTNMLAEFFVEANRGLRSANARLVRESIESLASVGELEFEETKQALDDLLVAHPHELESQRQSNEQTIERLQEELEEIEKVVRAAQRRLRVLEAQHASTSLIWESDHVPAGGETPEIGGENSQIFQIEQELEKLLITRTENHPDVVAKRRELERHRAAFEGGADTEETSPDTTEQQEQPTAQLPTLDIWQTRLQAAKLETERLERRRQQVRQGLARYQSYLMSTPVIQRQVDDLTARMQVLQQMHLENQSKIETARTGQRLEEEDIANPFAITRHAATPALPVSPNRLTFLLAGVAGGLLLFTGPVFVQAFLKPTILSEASLSLLADVPLLAVIPIMPTPAAARLRRRANLRNFGLSALAMAMAAGVAVVQYMDLI